LRLTFEALGRVWNRRPSLAETRWIGF
jgi:hypothetical protein